MGRHVIERLNRDVTAVTQSRRSGDESEVSITYWTTSHDTCTADCVTTWDSTDEARTAGWNRPLPLDDHEPRIGGGAD